MIPQQFSSLPQSKAAFAKLRVTVRSRETSGSNPMANCSPLSASDEEVIRQDAFSSSRGKLRLLCIVFVFCIVQSLPRGHKP